MIFLTISQHYVFREESGKVCVAKNLGGGGGGGTSIDWDTGCAIF